MEEFENVYFLGIGGIGMSALARWYKQQGFHVGGYDKTASALTESLSEEGLDIHYDDKVGRIPTAFYKKESTLVVYTPAVPVDNIEFEYFKGHDYVMMKRAQALGLITKNNFTIAIAGTHGKTTTSTMVAHLLQTADIKCSAFLGGISVNFGTNMLIGEPGSPVVVEADEYDRSFLTLYPSIAAVTSMDADHLDIYGTHEEIIKSFNAFIAQVSKTVIVKSGLEYTKPAAVKGLSYSLGKGGEYRAENVRVENGAFFFDFVTPAGKKLKDLEMWLPGFHNVENAVAALACCVEYGVELEKLRKGVETYAGAKRRFEYYVREGKTVLIDDYAHHPEEVKAFLSSVKALYPGKKVTAIFQPHLFTRTRDFANEFAESLSLVDDVVLLDIYPARELPIAGVTSEIILDELTCKSSQIVPKEHLLNWVRKCKTDVLVTIGAGDIDRLLPEMKDILSLKA